FTEPPGLANSSFRYTSTLGADRATRSKRKSGVLPTASITDDRRFERTSLILGSTDLQSAAELRKGSPRSRADVARGREAEGGGVRERRRRLGGPHRHAADSCAREIRAFHVGSVFAAHDRREAPDALLPARTDFCEHFLATIPISVVHFLFRRRRRG